jgi:uncharacterized protein YkwD
MNKTSVVLLVLLIPAVLLAQSADRPCHKASERICAMEAEMFRLVNVERVKRGIKPLAYLQEYAFVARDWSMQQYRLDKLSHDGYPENRMRVLRKEFGSIPYFMCGENCLMMPIIDDEDNDLDVVGYMISSWMGSTGHRENILKRKTTHIGCGIYFENGEYYATQLFAIKNTELYASASSVNHPQKKKKKKRFSWDQLFARTRH